MALPYPPPQPHLQYALTETQVGMRARARTGTCAHFGLEIAGLVIAGEGGEEWERDGERWTGGRDWLC